MGALVAIWSSFCAPATRKPSVDEFLSLGLVAVAYGLAQLSLASGFLPCLPPAWRCNA